MHTLRSVFPSACVIQNHSTMSEQAGWHLCMCVYFCHLPHLDACIHHCNRDTEPQWPPQSSHLQSSLCLISNPWELIVCFHLSFLSFDLVTLAYMYEIKYHVAFVDWLFLLRKCPWDPPKLFRNPSCSILLMNSVP